MEVQADTADFDLEITPAGRLVPLQLHEIWHFRDLVFFMVGRDIKGRYRQTAFGPLWMIIDPIINMCLFTLIFSLVAKLPTTDNMPYPLFNYSALLPWNFFGCCVFSASGSLLNYRHLISKVYFPRLSIPLVGMLTGLVDFLISMVILLLMGMVLGYYPTWRLVFVPVLLVMMAGIGFSVGLWFAPWVVHFQDVSSLLGYAMRVWMYASPVVYASALIPEHWRYLYSWNPLTHILEAFRWSVLGVGSPPGPMLWITFLMFMPLLVGGAYYFRHAEKNIVDIA